MTNFALLALIVAAPQFTMTFLDGSTGTMKPLDSTDWFSLQSGRPRPGFPREAQLIFTNGDRLTADVLKGTDRSVTVKAFDQEVTVPLTVLDVLWFLAPPRGTPAFPDRYDWMPPERKHDYLKLRNGEVLAGDFAGFTGTGDLRWTENNKERLIPRNVAAALAINPALTLRKTAKGVRYQTVFTDGSRITATAIKFDGTSFDIKYYSDLKASAASVVAITRWSETVVPLSSLKPAKVEETPVGGLAWPHGLNRTVKYEPLTLKLRDVETFSNGIGTHPKSRLTYRLDGSYRSFESQVGLDAITGKAGHATIIVKADDNELLNRLIAAADPPTSLKLDTTNAKTLTLKTEPAGSDAQADINWINARVILK